MYTEQTFLGKTFYRGHLFQIDIEDHFPAILSKGKDDEINILVVGAWHGDEIQSFLKFKNVHIWAFEPNPTNFNYLQKRYQNNKNVTCLQVACGEDAGDLPLYEATITGNDSLLEIKESNRIQLKDVHMVRVKRLDSIPEILDKKIDLLWIDAQGYELPILKGAEKIMANIQSMFLEVNEDDRTYKGTTIFSNLISFLEEKGFYIAHKEIDPKDRTGNAFFLRKTILSEFFNDQVAYRKRLSISLENRRRSIIVTNSFMYHLGSRIMPTPLRAFIKKVLHI